MKRWAIIPILFLCLALGGCGWLDGSYVSVKAHQSQRQSVRTEALTASDYQDLTEVLESLIAEGVESEVINVAAYPSQTLAGGMTAAIRYATERYPLGAYAVSDIQYELGANNGLPALAISITYRHSLAQLRAIRTVADGEAAQQAVTQALEEYATELVLRIQHYEEADYAQLVRSYAEEHPDLVMETPQVTTVVYGKGQEKVVELTFGYQNSPEDLRKMRSQVEPVFNAAALYVSGDGKDRQKLSQLYAFLMERFPYQMETSITPAYSLLRHGVGDSRAFALVYAAMCREAGLTCLTVTGTCAGEPRTWNIVLDDGRYYHLDLLRCYTSGGFRELTDDKMSGYVWDYSAYPACPAATSTGTQTGDSGSSSPADTAAPATDPTGSTTAETEAAETVPEAAETTPETTEEKSQDF